MNIKILNFIKMKKRKQTDKKLLMNYNQGWNDEMNGKDKKFFNNSLLQRAYNIGRLDYVTGDDVESVDIQTNEQILKHIKAE